MMILGILFYSDWDEDHPVIGSANMDGSNVTVIQKSPRVKWPNGLTIDYQSNRLFWVDAQKDLVNVYFGRCFYVSTVA